MFSFRPNRILLCRPSRAPAFVCRIPCRAAVLLGGHVRVGFEDNLYLEAGKLSPSNAALVDKAAGIIRALGSDVATPDEARGLLGLNT